MLWKNRGQIVSYDAHADITRDVTDDDDDVEDEERERERKIYIATITKMIVLSVSLQYRKETDIYIYINNGMEKQRASSKARVSGVEEKTRRGMNMNREPNIISNCLQIFTPDTHKIYILVAAGAINTRPRWKLCVNHVAFGRATMRLVLIKSLYAAEWSKCRITDTRPCSKRSVIDAHGIKAMLKSGVKC